MSKRIAIVLLCLAIAMTLGACSKPFGGTPYESLSGWETDFSDMTDGTESDEFPTVDSSTGFSTTDTDTSSTTTISGQSTSHSDATSTSASTTQPKVSGGTTSASTTTKPAGGTSSKDTTTGSTTTTAAPTTNTTVAQVKGVQLPAEGYTQDGRLVVSKVSLQNKTVSITFTNIAKSFQTEDISKVDYVCYDEDGKELSVGTLSIGALDPDKSVTRTFELSEDTDRVELRNWKVPFWTVEYY